MQAVLDCIWVYERLVKSLIDKQYISLLLFCDIILILGTNILHPFHSHIFSVPPGHPTSKCRFRALVYTMAESAQCEVKLSAISCLVPINWLVVVGVKSCREMSAPNLAREEVILE